MSLSAAPSLPPLEEGQVVWVSVGKNREELALVLKTGCGCFDSEKEENDDHGASEISRNVRSGGEKDPPRKASSSNSSKTSGGTSWRDDGVLVQLSSSMIKGIYPASKVCPFIAEDEVNDATNSVRRRRAPPRRHSSHSSSSTWQGARPSSKRSAVTPSPTTATPSSSSSNRTASSTKRHKMESPGDLAAAKSSSVVNRRSRKRPTQESSESEDSSEPEVNEPKQKTTGGRMRRDEETAAKKPFFSHVLSAGEMKAAPSSCSRAMNKKKSANAAVAESSSSSWSASSSASSSDTDPPPAAAGKRQAVGRKSAGVTTTAALPQQQRLTASNKERNMELIEVSSSSDTESEVVVVDGAAGINEEGSGDDDRPYTIERSPTGRATCRRCDRVISKNSLRVSHVPLFRGKPGYRVYRHLECAVFGDDVTCVQDVAGWESLDAADVELLRQRVIASQRELEEENREIQPDELVQLAFDGPIRPPPPGLWASLLPFQVEGVSWMHAQEQTEVRGGILADEMGLGKTIQTIVTILDNRPKLQHSLPGAKHPPGTDDLEVRIQEEAMWQAAAHEWRHEMVMNNVSRKAWPKGRAAAARAGTLVVCPVIALSQWKSEIEKFTEPGSLSVGVYHGPDREKQMPRELLAKYDVVLTTYQVLEQDFRKMVSPNKVACPNCGAKFKIDKLRVHLKYFCGEGARRTEAQMRQRRTADRPGRRRSSSDRKDGGNKDGKKQSPPTKTKKPLQATKAKKWSPPVPEAKPKPSKSRLKIQCVEDYDSERELSAEETSGLEIPSSRPIRSAAMNASRRVSASYREWNAASSTKGGIRAYDDEENDDDYKYSSDESRASESDDSVNLRNSVSSKKPPVKLWARGRKQAAARPSSVAKRKHSEINDDDEESDNDDDDEETMALDRARAKQQAALDVARRSKKGTISSKAKGGTKKISPSNLKATGKARKKKFDDESSSTESSDSGDDIDPLAGVDIDELMEEAMVGAKFSVLHGFTWWRCVLDEAHFIKSRSSQTAASAFALTCVHRWCLSGTPLQNRVGELYSLIRFVRLDPMSHYFCRQCSCKSIHYRMQQGVCQDCGHRAFSHFSHFNKHVLNPIQRDGYTGDGRRAMFILKNDVLDKCLLRRTKENRAEDMNLPPRLVTIRPVRLHPVEEDFYNALYTQTKSSFDDYVAEGTLLNNYAHIFDLLTKMRQAVNHPYLIVYSNSDKVRALHQPQRQAAPLVANGSVDCDMCHEPPVERVVSSCCGSGFCRSCVIDYLTGAVGDNTPCPSCARPFTIDLNQANVDINQLSSVDTEVAESIAPESKMSSPGSQYIVPSLKHLPHVPSGSILRRINLAEFATSTKIEVLVQELTEMRQKRPGNKALVFSQFVNMLDLIRWRLHSDPCLAGLGLGVRILHGGMDVKSRDAALKDFREDPTCRVLLMSLKSAGVALNLTVASECYLTDLWWNPAAEMQAIDRTHRLGQYRPIRAVRLVAEGTVEERVLQLQEKKRLVFDGTVGRDAGSLKMLTVDDMVQLFS